MYCENCGEFLDNDAKFCPKCGEKINKSDASIQASIIGDKGVVAGDVYAGDRTEIKGNYNVTNVYNNIVESSICAVCGKRCTNDQDSYKCSECGKIICRSCFIKEKKICRDCLEAEFLNAFNEDAIQLEKKIENNPSYFITDNDSPTYKVITSLSSLKNYYSNNLKITEMKDRKGRTLFHYILSRLHISKTRDFVVFLLNNGANPFDEDMQGETPVTLLIKSGHKNAAGRIRDLTESYNYSRPDVLSKIIDSIKDSQQNGRLWYRITENWFSSDDIKKATHRLLNHVVKERNNMDLRIIKNLVIKGADVRVMNNLILLYACRYGDSDDSINTVKLLLATGANPDIIYEDGNLARIFEANRTYYSIGIASAIMNSSEINYSTASVITREINWLRENQSAYRNLDVPQKLINVFESVLHR